MWGKFCWKVTRMAPRNGFSPIANVLISQKKQKMSQIQIIGIFVLKAVNHLTAQRSWTVNITIRWSFSASKCANRCVLLSERRALSLSWLPQLRVNTCCHVGSWILTPQVCGTHTFSKQRNVCVWFHEKWSPRHPLSVSLWALFWSACLLFNLLTSRKRKLSVRLCAGAKHWSEMPLL